jgi:hypothetical protein
MSIIKRTDIERFIDFTINQTVNAVAGEINGDGPFDREELLQRCSDEVQASLQFLHAPVQRKRIAAVLGGARSLEAVQNYLPSNYIARKDDDRTTIAPIIIEGYDRAGWTLDAYVIPRLASGLITAIEIFEEIKS